MKAIRIHANGGPEVLRWEDAPDPRPGPGQALVRLEAIGLNFIDVYFRKGIYPSKMPFIPGKEGAGVVEALGEGVSGLSVGQRVAWAGTQGAYAELAAVPAEELVPVPEGLGSREAAAAMLQGMTAHYLATSTYPLKPGDRCLVHAAAGGVGLLLVQIARSRGARVLATVSTPEKAALAKEAGAERVVLVPGEDFEAAAKEFSGGEGLQVVYDGVGKDTFEKGLRCLAPRGLMALFGQSSGPVGPVDAQVLNARGSLFLTRPSLGHYTRTRDELLTRAGDVLGWIGSGKLKLRIGAEFPLEKAADAHRALEGRKTTGKVLLKPRGFTLIELMVVVAIIGILAAVALPRFATLLRKSRDGATKGQLGAVRSALMVYYGDMQGTFPSDDLSSLTLNGKYIRSIPAADVGQHLPSSGVCVGLASIPGGCSLGLGMPASYDGQLGPLWIYWETDTPPASGPVRNHGDFWLSCTHTDSKGSVWTTY